MLVVHDDEGPQMTWPEVVYSHGSGEAEAMVR